jgi:SAM-dependent methyltransferase
LCNKFKKSNGKNWRKMVKNAGGYEDYKFVAELYDYVPPYQDRQDVKFYVEMAKELQGPVLEIGCGTGRVLIPTARAGIEIVGLDLSTHMLDICRQRLEQEGEDVKAKVRLVEADMRDFELSRKFQLITIPFRPFQHLTTTKDQIACLTAVRSHLNTGGRFILDFFNPALEALVGEIGKEVGDEPEFSMPDGRRVIRRHKIVERDYFNQINYVELIYYVTHQNGKEERLVHSFPMKYLFRYEAEHLLARCGFEIEQVYSDYDKSPYGTKYPGELIFVVRNTE